MLLLYLNPWLRWDVEGLEDLNKKNRYLPVSNHHSQADVVALYMLFRKHILMNKYSLKQRLAWVLSIGLACWVLDMPFMRRYSCSYLIRHPECHGKDVETTRCLCEEFHAHPTTIVSFAEGLHSTEAKEYETRSPYDNLLPPKVTGIAMALNVLGLQFNKLLNVALCYPGNNTKLFYDMLNGRLTYTIVRINLVPIGEELHSDYVSDRNFKRGPQRWLNGLWEEKDCQLTNIMWDKEG